jgi:hypothetical protein
MIALFISPSSCLQSVADDGLPAIMDGDGLDSDVLFAARAIFLQRLDLCRERQRALAEHAFNLRQTSCDGHRGVVYGCHLSGEHCLGVVARTCCAHAEPSKGLPKNSRRSFGGRTVCENNDREQNDQIQNQEHDTLKKVSPGGSISDSQQAQQQPPDALRDQPYKHSYSFGQCEENEQHTC